LIKIIKNPGNGRLNNLNDPVLNVLIAQHVFGDTLPIIRSSKTVIAVSGFTYVFGCRPLRWLSHRSGRQPKTCVRPEAAITVIELLMMGGVSPETCWAIKKHWNNKFYYTVASCLFFLWDLYYDARIHEHQLITMFSEIQQGLDTAEARAHSWS